MRHATRRVLLGSAATLALPNVVRASATRLLRPFRK
jgi:hypothetical protein